MVLRYDYPIEHIGENPAAGDKPLSDRLYGCIVHADVVQPG